MSQTAKSTHKLNPSRGSYTPGPWEYVEAEYLSHDAPEQGPCLREGGIWALSGEEACWIFEGEIENKANASLIAAAPDLLAALRLILPLAKGYAAANCVGSNNRYCDVAEAAIAKAEGRS